MPGLMDLLSQTLGGDTTSQISRKVGADPAATSTAIAAAIPMLLAGLTRNASQPGGANALHDALTRDHDGSLLDNMSGLLGNPQSGQGAGILGHVLGDRQEHAENAISGVSGLDKRQVTALLITLAPVVLAALGRMQRQRNLDAGGLASTLGQEHEQHAQAAPDLMAMASKLFGGGGGNASPMDDVLRTVGGLFGKS